VEIDANGNVTAAPYGAHPSGRLIYSSEGTMAVVIREYGTSPGVAYAGEAIQVAGDQIRHVIRVGFPPTPKTRCGRCGSPTGRSSCWRPTWSTTEASNSTGSAAEQPRPEELATFAGKHVDRKAFEIGRIVVDGGTGVVGELGGGVDLAVAGRERVPDGPCGGLVGQTPYRS